MKRYVWNVLIAVDQLFNTLAAGDPDETISSRMGKQLPTCRFCRFMCKLLHRLDPHHCERSIEADEGEPPVSV